MFLDPNKCLRFWPIFYSIQRPETTLASMSVNMKHVSSKLKTRLWSPCSSWHLDCQAFILLGCDQHAFHFSAVAIQLCFIRVCRCWFNSYILFKSMNFTSVSKLTFLNDKVTLKSGRGSLGIRRRKTWIVQGPRRWRCPGFDPQFAQVA